MNRESKAEIYLLTGAVIGGIAPIAFKLSTNVLPPLFVMLVSVFLAAVIGVVFLIPERDWSFLRDRRALWLIALVALFNHGGHTLTLVATKYTSGLNTALLLQTEVVFTYLIHGLFFGEKMTRDKLIGGALLFLGALLVALNGTYVFNPGDLLILLGVFLFPFGNYFQKIVLKRVSVASVLVLRSLFAGVILLPLTLLFEGTWGQVGSMISNHWILLLYMGVVTYGIGKIVFLYGLKVVDVGKAIAISTSRIAVSLLFAYLFLFESPTLWQWGGVVLIIWGLFRMTRKNASGLLTEEVA